MAARSLVILAFGGFIALGLPDGSLGVAWPSMAEEFERRISELGILLTALVAGYMLSSVLFGAVTRRVGTGAVLIASSVLSAAALLTYAFTPWWGLLVVATFFLGLGMALIDAGINAYMALNHGPRLMNWLHASFGIGATLGPLLMTFSLVVADSWRMAYGVLGVIQIGLAVAFVRTRKAWGYPPSPEPSQAAAEEGRRAVTVVIVAGLIVFVLYTGLEVAAGQWSFTVLTEDRGLATGLAGILVAAYWGSLTAGRILAGVAGVRIPPEHMITGGIVTALAGTLLFWWNPVNWAGALGLVIIGFGLAPIFPALILLTPVRVGAARATAVVGYQLAAAGVGAALIPGGIGLLVEAYGLDAVGPALAATALALLAMAEVLHRLGAQVPPPSSQPLASADPP